MKEKIPENMMQLGRPQPALWTYYIVKAILTGPGVIIMLPYLFCRYYTLRYSFDNEGIHMRVGVFFRRETNLTYARIQDIHLRSGILQRWFGLAEVQVQTASGSSTPELVIEGFKEFENIRDFLYSKMRGRSGNPKTVITPDIQPTNGDEEMVQLLHTLRDDLRGIRENMERSRTQLSNV